MNSKLLFIQVPSRVSNPWTDNVLNTLVLSKLHKAVAQANAQYREEKNWIPLATPVRIFSDSKEVSRKKESMFFMTWTEVKYSVDMVIEFDHELTDSELAAWRAFKYGFLSGTWAHAYLYH